MTQSIGDSFKIAFRCAGCGRKSEESVNGLGAKDTVTCAWCGRTDPQSDELRAAVKQTLKTIAKLWRKGLK